MQTARRATARFWATPIFGVVIGLVYLVGFWVGGKPAVGVGGLALMVACSAVLAVAGRRSETVRGLLDQRDERIAGIDLQATAFTALAMMLRSWSASSSRSATAAAARPTTGSAPSAAWRTSPR